MNESMLHASLPEAMPEVAPFDDHNRRLLWHGHPPDWQNPPPRSRYNLVVIGGGTAGLVTAAGAAGLGARVALVERRLLGGDCLNVGCVPSKALIRAARAAAAVRNAGAFGVEVPAGVRVDFPAVMERMRRLRAHLSGHDSAQRFRDLGVDVFLGNAGFTGPDTVAVDGQTLRFARAVVATGSRASEPSIPGLKDAGYLTNETVFSLTELPRRLAVIGAGPIGCELAQAFARFGSEVFLIEALHGILPNDDPAAAEVVKRAMVRDGLHILCCGQDLQISRTEGGKRLCVDSHGEHYDLVVDDILVGVGRTPNVEGLGLEAAGVRYEHTGIAVNARLQTTNPRIYAAGDICSPYKFTHAADAMARLVIQNALFLGRAKASALTIPWCTYTDPEVAHVGLYAKQAEDKGIPVQTFVQPLAEVDRAVLDGDTDGFVKIHVRQGTDRILGATIVAPHAGEMLSEVTLAMVGRLGLKTLARTIHPYPTQAEVLRKVGDAYNRTRLTPFVKSLLTTWLGWTR
jgi:pyruvate/2-oxoglutarate dehydrogenase complex dihydrolipoamide dehydrogenase (E3) component